jgi:hypothetical protein
VIPAREKRGSAPGRGQRPSLHEARPRSTPGPAA